MCLFLHLPSYCELPEGCALLIIPSAWHMKALIIQKYFTEQRNRWISIIKPFEVLSFPFMTGHKTCVSCVRFFLYREALQKRSYSDSSSPLIPYEELSKWPIFQTFHFFRSKASKSSLILCLKLRVGAWYNVWKDFPLGLRLGQRKRLEVGGLWASLISQNLGSDIGYKLQRKKNSRWTHTTSKKKKSWRKLKKSFGEAWKWWESWGIRVLFTLFLYSLGMRWRRAGGKKEVLGSRFLCHFGGNYLYILMNYSSRNEEIKTLANITGEYNAITVVWKNVLYIFHCHLWGLDLSFFHFFFVENFSRDPRLSSED